VPVINLVGRCKAELSIVVAPRSSLVQRIDACLGALGVAA
jgi:hypothetical protein